MNSTQNNVVNNGEAVETAQAPSKNNYLETALEIGKRLALEAIWNDGRCNWIGDNLEASGIRHEVVVRSFNAELYSGVSGVALFLSKLFKQTKDPIIGYTLEGAIKTILWQLDQLKTPKAYGVFNGYMGVGWVLWQVGRDLKRPDISEKGIALLLELGQLPIKDHQVDIIDGAAGVVITLLKVWKVEQSEALLDAAKKAGDHLLKMADKQPTYWSWPVSFSAYPLTGYSHGAGGCATALLELYHDTNNKNYLEGAEKGFAYEREWFNREQGNWPDLREYKGQGAPNCGLSWCHGAPGVALSRLRAYELTGDATYWEEARVALVTTERSIRHNLANVTTARPNFSLCHGIAGNADILLEAGVKSNSQPYVDLAREVGNIGIELYGRHNLSWPSGVNDPTGETPGMGETPGLMLGMAGTGYFYLRLAGASDAPSVLY